MPEGHPSCGFWKSKTGLALIVFGAIAAIFLITEHQAHLWGWLPYMLLLACPLMHFFMHRGHGGHRHAHGGSREAAQTDPATHRPPPSHGREGDRS
ncbi:MAG: DUF2933 domain-containing protein [Betaproteobacteria bacterium]|nr:DUF2933 domain-containing protein [Betaproteobacteria bacterium]